MANRNTKAARKLASKKPYGENFFHGKACLTDFLDKDKNPANKRKSPWRGGKKQTGANRD